MPYEWVRNEGKAPDSSGAFSFGAGSVGAGDPPRAELHLWPYRSLPLKGFVWFIGGTALLVLIPLLAVLGSPVLWGLLPFVGGALLLTWLLLRRSYRDGEVLEELKIWTDKISLTRHNPRSPNQSWDANPYWVRVELRPHGGPVKDYLVLKGGPRDVEIGAFLSIEERQALYGELTQALSRLREAGHGPA